MESPMGPESRSRIVVKGCERVETGNVQNYAFVYLLGAIGIIAYYVWTGDSTDGWLCTDCADFRAAARRAP